MPKPLIQIENLSIALSGNMILKDVSLSINEGEYVSIIGPNGAGKTTLVKCLAGIYRDWTGDVAIGGKPFAGYPPKALAKLQSYVPQAEGRTNPLTVAEFVAMGRYPHLSAFTTLQAADYVCGDGPLPAPLRLHHLASRRLRRHRLRYRTRRTRSLPPP